MKLWKNSLQLWLTLPEHLLFQIFFGTCSSGAMSVCYLLIYGAFRVAKKSWFISNTPSFIPRFDPNLVYTQNIQFIPRIKLEFFQSLQLQLQSVLRSRFVWNQLQLVEYYSEISYSQQPISVQLVTVSEVLQRSQLQLVEYESGVNHSQWSIIEEVVTISGVSCRFGTIRSKIRNFKTIINTLILFNVFS